MDSVQRMRWVLVWMSAGAALVALALGYVLAGAILLTGVALHVGHAYRDRQSQSQPSTGSGADSSNSKPTVSGTRL